MKYLILTLILFIGYLTIKNSIYNYKSAAYFEFLEAKNKYNEESNRFDICEVVWKLREKQKFPLWLNCFDKDIDNSTADFSYKFGTNLDDGERFYQKYHNAISRYEYIDNNAPRLTLLNLIGIDGLPTSRLKFVGGVDKHCKRNDKDLHVFDIYEFSIWTSEGAIFIPEAKTILENCK